MDPYLEERALWMDVHLGLIAAIRHELQSLLVPRYYAHLGERVYIEDVRRALLPDVTVILSPNRNAPPSRGGATLVMDEPIIATYELQNREPYLEIRSASSHEVVTVIELLSPANKDVGRGNVEYRKKQEQLLASQVSFVEIDLLRGGDPTAAVTTGALAALPPHDYLAVVHRATARDRGEHYPFTLRDRLPRIGIPLLPGDADVPLDLPAAFQHCYEEGAYQVRVVYRQAPPPPPLSAEDTNWLASLLQEAGLRPGM
jgi:hypothetical protein